MTVDWAAVSARDLGVAGAVGAAGAELAYLIWYIGVQRIGAARTSVYSNVVPIVAMAVAAI